MGRRQYSLLPGNFAICRLAADADLPRWALRPGKFSSVSRTGEELSIVCAEEFVPPDIKAERGWACFKLEGPIPFFETGVLTSFIQPLSENAIPIFAVSTFATDYVLIKEECTERAATVLRSAGHEMISQAR